MHQILIAEDDNIDRKLLEAYLRDLDYEVISTKNGVEAWEIIQNKKTSPQIAIIDWLMPEMDGITLCKKIRELKDSVYIYIIVVTGKSMPEDMVFGLDAGADDYLVKPYEKSVLLARINVGNRIIRLEKERDEQLNRIQAAHRKMQQNMEAAVQIQLSLLPPRKLEFFDFKFDWYFKPSDLLGGDMLHIYRISETEIACYVLDVSGHGTQAALLSVTIRNLLTVSFVDNSSFLQTNSNISSEFHSTCPLGVIDNLSEHYLDLLEKTGHYFTIMYGILNTKTGVFEYISAGHHNPIVISNSEIISPEGSSGPPIGIFSKRNYQVKRLTLVPGDRLYLYTDGILEENNNEGEQFGKERFAEKLGKLSYEHDTLPKMVEYLGQWTSKEQFSDDIALIEIAYSDGKKTD
ncbi:SpoIIE family protein phosphatase [bacterium]|nr:SpoIIE family protein phosphatase [bacterium]